MIRKGSSEAKLTSRSTTANKVSMATPAASEARRLNDPPADRLGAREAVYEEEHAATAQNCPHGVDARASGAQARPLG